MMSTDKPLGRGQDQIMLDVALTFPTISSRRRVATAAPSFPLLGIGYQQDNANTVRYEIKLTWLDLAVSQFSTARTTAWMQVVIVINYKMKSSSLSERKGLHLRFAR